MTMLIRTVDAAWMPPDAPPADCAAVEYFDAELPKLSLVDAAALCRALDYVTALHGELSLRDIQIVCEVAAILRKGE